MFQEANKKCKNSKPKSSIPRHCEHGFYMLAKKLTRQHRSNKSYDGFCEKFLSDSRAGRPAQGVLEAVKK